MVITCGLQSIPAEGHEDDERNLLTMADIGMLQDVPSIPYRLDFYTPVVKVVSGDCFSGLLTAEG